MTDRIVLNESPNECKSSKAQPGSREYWVGEAGNALLSHRAVYTATPLQTCLNGCTRGAGDARTPVYTDGHQQLCHPCQDRVDTWLRAIPDNYALLPSVVDHGSVPADPGTKRTKRPDPPAPMRLEVTDLLDTRTGFGVLGQLAPWADLVREERRQPLRCWCGHMALGHDTTGKCTATKCKCRDYAPTKTSVTSEAGFLLTNLPWIVEQDWANEIYDELRGIHRTLAITVGDRPPQPVGTCQRTLDDGLCGGALVMDRDHAGVHCLACGTRHEANQELRELGLTVGRLLGQEAS